MYDVDISITLAAEFVLTLYFISSIFSIFFTLLYLLRLN